MHEVRGPLKAQGALVVPCAALVMVEGEEHLCLLILIGHATPEMAQVAEEGEELPSQVVLGLDQEPLG